MCKEYNGWSNYETWNVALWLDNGGGFYEIIQESLPISKPDLSDLIKTMVEEEMPVLKNSMYSDLLNGAISKIDFFEIAEHYISDSEG